ncbi:hypothetical protein BDV59DRAFT_201902 [Aspergillus ambiguus]|uniref:uncharacterized protein n=1 Tax=Aspergillus ambiguus TaxID=176160 RepID=UPI003CCE21EF
MDDFTSLLCNICPKRPKFSDVSHLLTHVSSKAHLSHYFKLQVRSHQESEAVFLLEEYDQWYKSNNLAKLLADRMSSKAARKKKSQGRQTTLTKSVLEGKEAQAQIPPMATDPSPQTPFPAYLDPRLTGPILNTDTGVADDDFSVFTAYTSLVTESTVDIQPQLETNSTVFSAGGLRAHPGDLALRQWKEEIVSDSDDGGISPMKYPPMSPMESARTVASQPLRRHLSYDPFIDENDLDRERSDEISRLKGVLWPGMDIFDSATEQMRRKRNQKKDGSILKKMEKTSLGVEPTELVFSPTGILRKQRVISGNVEDDSPLKGESPIPKRRTSRPKRALSQVDSNITRAQDRRRYQKRKSTLKRTQDGLSRSRLPFRSAQGSAPFGNSSHNADPDEFALAIRKSDSRHRNGLSVFKDSSDKGGSRMKDHGGRYEPRVGDSTRTDGNYLSHDAIALLSTARHALGSSGRSPGFGSKKENIEPPLDSHGRILSSFDWESPTARPFPNDAAYPPRCFFHDPQHINLNPFEGNDSPTGYSYKPLAGSFGKLDPEESPIYTTDSKDCVTSDAVPHSRSPDATISDLGDDEFERLYLDGSCC